MLISKRFAIVGVLLLVSVLAEPAWRTPRGGPSIGRSWREPRAEQCAFSTSGHLASFSVAMAAPMRVATFGRSGSAPSEHRIAMPRSSRLKEAAPSYPSVQEVPIGSNV